MTPELTALDVVLPDALSGSRADRVVAELLEVSTNAARRLIEARRVRVDGKLAKKGDSLRAGARVVVEGHGGWLVPGSPPPDSVPRLHVDDRVIIVDKPAGMPSHPLLPGEGGTVVDALVALFPEIANASSDAREGGLLHRLDTGTSGCLAVARDPASWAAYRQAFIDGNVFKRYLALVEGEVAPRIVVDAFLAHDSKDPRRMKAAASGLAARTTALRLHGNRAVSLVEVEAEGGRRHQVRVHLASAGHPLVGDVLYGAQAAPETAWHLLHASALGLPGAPVIRAALPVVFREAAASRGLIVPDEAI